MRVWVYMLIMAAAFFQKHVAAQVITASEELSFRNDDFYELAGKLQDEYIVYRLRGGDHELLFFDERLQLRRERQIFPSGNRQEPLAVKVRDSTIALCYISREKEGGYALRVEQYSAFGLPLDTAIVSRYKYSSPSPEVAFSEDEQILLAYDVLYNKGVEVAAFHMGLMNPVWQRSIAFDNPDSPLDLEQVLVTNGAELFMVFDRNNQKGKIEEHHLDIFHFDYATDSSQRIIIGMAEYLITDARYAYDELNDRVVGTGFVSQDNPSRSDGIFYFGFDPAYPEGQSLSILEIPKSLISSILSTPAIQKDQSLEGLKAKNLVLRKDGGALLAAEITRVIERQIASSGRMVSANFSIDYYYEDVLLLAIHPEGTLHWHSVLHKRQFSQDDNGIYSSFFMATTPEALRFVFNDEIRYENTVSEYVVNGLGRQFRSSVLSTENQKLRLRFSDAMQVGPNELIVPSDFRNKLRLVRIRY
jgi:hypothetical protein